MVPDTILIQGVKWSVKVMDELHDDLGRPAHGLCDPEQRTLFLLKNKKDSMMHTLYHEIWHAICEQSGLHQAYDYNMNYEEIQAEQFANFFMSGAIRLSFKKGVTKSPHREG